MTHDPQYVTEEALAGVDLQAWRVPPPIAVDRSALLLRALSPAAAPVKPKRLRWMFAAIVLVNAVIATLIVILLSRAPAPQRVVVQAAGGGSVDAQVRDLLQRLEQEQRELETKLAEIQELRALVTELSERVRKYEGGERQDRTIPKQPARPIPRLPDPPPQDPFQARSPADSCDEVSCVLQNYPGTCCTKYRRPSAQAAPPGIPESLDRETISAGMASVKTTVAECGDHSTATGKVRAHIHVAPTGLVTKVEIQVTPDAALGSCVAAALKHAVFARTQAGGDFSYPFVF